MYKAPPRRVSSEHCTKPTRRRPTSAVLPSERLATDQYTWAENVAVRRGMGAVDLAPDMSDYVGKLSCRGAF